MPKPGLGEVMHTAEWTVEEGGRHPQRRLPSEVATHMLRGGHVRPPERNRG